MTAGRSGGDLVLPVHLGFVVVLGIATIVLFGVPTGDGDCCVPVAILGLVTLGELIAVLIGIATAGLTGRHAPLAFVDAVVVTPLIALVPSVPDGAPGSSPLLPLVVAGLLVAGLASAILAARVVREHSLERLVLAGALVLLAAFSLAAPVTTVVPIIVLAAALWPHLEHSGPVTASAPGRTAAGPAGRPAGRRGAPDAAAILGRRSSGREPALPVTPSTAMPPAAAPDEPDPRGPSASG